jgi:DNA-binding transcriptional ArsR family regulator
MPHPLEHSSADRPLDRREADEIAESMRAFAAGSRVRLLFALIGADRSVEELAEIVEMEPSAVSQQLRVLRQLRFVTAERDGRHIRYRLHDHHIGDLLAAVRHHGEHAAGNGPDAASARVSGDRVTDELR